MATLVEETGYSYSGVADIVHNDPERSQELLLSINDEYLKAKAEQEELEKKLAHAKSQRSHLVSCFLHFMQARQEESLVYEAGNNVVVVQRLDSNAIDYSAYEKTDFQNS